MTTGPQDTPRSPLDPSGQGLAPARRPARPTTIVWGMVLVAVGALVLAEAAGASLDLQLVAIVGLAVAGAALLVGAVVAATRGHRRGRE